MTDKQKENLKLGIKALRENPAKAKGQMRDDHGGRCCLCVLSEVAEDIEGVPPNTFTYHEKYGPAILPTSDLSDIFGLPNSNIGVPEFNFNINNVPASNWNDGNDVPELSHVEIADMIEKEFLGEDKN